MMKKHYDDDLFVDNPTFVHEISSNDVKEQSFNNEKEGKRVFIIVIIVFLLALLLTVLGVYFLVNSKKNSDDINPINAELFVVHSKSTFGDIITNFSNYNSIDNAFEYTFYVENQNNFDAWYRITLVDNYDTKISQFKYDKKKINYAIEKNNNIIFKGILDDSKEIALNSSKILKGTKDNFKIKFWSSKFDGDGYYSFKIKVQI